MKKFVVYLLVIVLAVSLGFAVFYLVRDDEVISISSASIYTDVNKDFTIDVNHKNKKSHTRISISSSDENIVKFNADANTFSAISGGVARVNFRTNNAKFRNLWCDVIVGDGTEVSPFYISSVEQLRAIGMGADLGNGVFAGAEPYTDYSSDKCYKLVADIDVKGINEGHWIPLRNFKGTFDGNGYTISNVNINYDSYTEIFKDANDYNPNLHATDNVGLFQSIDKTGRVFNIKMSNFRASGRYVNFGTVAGINYGTIERIEVKDAYISVENRDVVNGAIGGLVGQNITSDIGSGTNYERFVARIDRCSVNLTMGKKRTFENEEFVEHVIGVNGVVGGLVGINVGGTIVYSYTNGEVNFGADNLEEIVYGGVIGKNTFATLADKGGLFPTIYQGANVKDCYSNIKTHMETALVNANTIISGAIAQNIDFTNSLYNNEFDKAVVQNYIIGIYYNAENLNAEDAGITKNYNGIGKFDYNKGSATIEGVTLPIVTGLTNAQMKDSNNFISHYTSDIQFDEEGNSEGIKSIPVSWLFGTVWAIDDSNDGMPYLNYQLVYIPNDFYTVGTPVVISSRYQYINSEVEYPVTIVSGHEGRIDLQVGESYNLKVSPAGLSVVWDSNNPSVVGVNSNGTIVGLKPGSASISVSTKTGLYSDYIDVYVSDASYSISNLPECINLTVGDTYTFAGITVTPYAPLEYSVLSGNIATIDATGKLTALSAGSTQVVVSAGSAKKYVTLTVYAKTDTTKTVMITLDKSVYDYEFQGNIISGKINILSALCEGSDIKNSLSYTYTSSNTNIVSVDANGNFNIKGSGTVAVSVQVNTANYTGIAYAFFRITEKQVVSVPTGITAGNYTVYVGNSIRINTYGDIVYSSWSSTNPSIATVNNGIVTGVSAGVVAITATFIKSDGTSVLASCNVIVKQYVQDSGEVGLEKPHYGIFVGDTFHINTYGNISSIKWYTNNTNIAVVSDSVFNGRIAGEVTGKGVGIATITAVITKTNGSVVSTSCTVTVYETDAAAGITKDAYSINVGESIAIATFGNIKSITWATSNANVATIANGVAKGIAAGTATIIATITKSNNAQITDTCVITVCNNQTVVSGPAGITRDSVNIKVGDTLTLATYGDISNITWRTSNNTIATVSNGLITGVSQGTATIYAEIKKADGTYAYDSCDVTVIDNKPSPVITLSPATANVTTGATVNLTATFNLNETLNWSITSSPVGIATLNQTSNTTATVTMNGAGTATVTVSYNGYVKTAKITATAPNVYVREIRTIEQLDNVRNFLDREFVLVADLNLTGINWTPIGTEAKPFTGSFTSNLKNATESFKITGLKVDSVYGGLFGYTKNATIKNVHVANSTIKGSTAAGAIIGVANSTNIANVKSINNTITSVNAGGIVGKMLTNTLIFGCQVNDTTVTTVTTTNGNIGGVVGQMMSNTKIYNGRVNNANNYISISSASHGNAGGIAGKSAGWIDFCKVTAKVVANDADTDYAGGIVGSSAGTISNSVVTSTYIEGHYAGGIGGELNTSRVITLTFDKTNKGYRYEDLANNPNYAIDVNNVAVHDSVTIKGEKAGGLFSIIKSGVVMNCYTRASLDGYSKSSHASGLVSLIYSHGFNKQGGTGEVGIIENCYSACSFSKATRNHAISESLVHQSIDNRDCGYIFNYVFDKDLAKGADFVSGLLLNDDPADAKKSTSDMKNKDTYTSKNFSATYWRYSNDYPTLSCEVSFN